MLSQKHYSTKDVDRCRETFARHINAFRDSAGSGHDVTTLEGSYTQTLVIALDAWFVHRMRGAEGKNGNPLNETRVIVDSLINHNGVYTLDSKIKHDPDGSVLGLDAGDQIRLSIDDLEKLVQAFLDEIVARYPDES